MERNKICIQFFRTYRSVGIKKETNMLHIYNIYIFFHFCTFLGIYTHRGKKKKKKLGFKCNEKWGKIILEEEVGLIALGVLCREFRSRDIYELKTIQRL